MLRYRSVYSLYEPVHAGNQYTWRKLLDSILYGIALWFVWSCACLHGFLYKKPHLRAVFRHLNPATRISSRTLFLYYIRGHPITNRTRRLIETPEAQLAKSAVVDG